MHLKTEQASMQICLHFVPCAAFFGGPLAAKRISCHPVHCWHELPQAARLAGNFFAPVFAMAGALARNASNPDRSVEVGEKLAGQIADG